MFKVNVGDLDRALLVVLGLSLVGLALTDVIGAWGWLGLLPLATAAVGICPLYHLLGIRSAPPQA